MFAHLRAAILVMAALFLGTEAGAQPAHCATKTATGECVPAAVLVNPSTGLPYAATGGGGGGGDASAANQTTQIAAEQAIRDRLGALTSPAAGSTNALLGAVVLGLNTLAPASSALDIVPSDTVALTDIPKAIYVGTGGTIVMRGANGTADRTWKNVPAGSIIPFRPQYIRATGTTAADMLALY